MGSNELSISRKHLHAGCDRDATAGPVSKWISANISDNISDNDSKAVPGCEKINHPAHSGRPSRPARSLDQRHLTPMERPAALRESHAHRRRSEARTRRRICKSTISTSEVAAASRATGAAGTGGYNNLFIDRGSELARVDGVKRTSLIVDPPDGRMPPMRPRCAAEAGRRRPGRGIRRHELRQRERPGRFPSAA